MLGITKRNTANTNGNKFKCSSCANSRISLPEKLTEDQYIALDRLPKASRLLNKGKALRYAERHIMILNTDELCKLTGPAKHA